MTTPHGYPSHLYHCLLDEQPYYLAPQRLFFSGAFGPLMVNPTCWFSWHGPLPADKAMRAFAADHVFPAEGVVWVDDPGTRAIWPYSVGPEYLSYLSALAPGMPLTFQLPEHALWVLTQADVLVGPGYVERRRRAWLDAVRHASHGFERGFVSVQGLVPAFQIGALRRYYRVHARLGSFPLGDDQVPTRLVAHNEALAAYVHHQLTTAMSDIAGRLVKPSYSYMVSYQPGSVLERHTDREQCEYSITMCIDATPEPDAHTPWPIHLDLPDGTLQVWQALGDGLFYRGRDIAHHRDRLFDGYTSTSLLLHYVDDAFDGSLS
jgi:hypothetical protein